MRELLCEITLHTNSPILASKTKNTANGGTKDSDVLNKDFPTGETNNYNKANSNAHTVERLESQAWGEGG